jgi:hypothetical protein
MVAGFVDDGYVQRFFGTATGEGLLDIQAGGR